MGSLTVSLKLARVTSDVTLQYGSTISITALIFYIQASYPRPVNRTQDKMSILMQPINIPKKFGNVQSGRTLTN